MTSPGSKKYVMKQVQKRDDVLQRTYCATILTCYKCASFENRSKIQPYLFYCAREDE